MRFFYLRFKYLKENLKEGRKGVVFIFLFIGGACFKFLFFEILVRVDFYGLLVYNFRYFWRKVFFWIVGAGVWFLGRFRMEFF